MSATNRRHRREQMESRIRHILERQGRINVPGVISELIGEGRWTGGVPTTTSVAAILRGMRARGDVVIERSPKGSTYGLPEPGRTVR